MVPISKSIWQLILFVYLNLHFMSMVRFNLFYCFSKIFFRKRSKASPPNFAPPFCALCLIVCDFLPKTWNLRRKEGKSVLSGGAPLPSAPVGRSHLPQGDGLTRSGKTEGVPPPVKKGYRNARRRFCTPKFKIILPLQQRRPPPAAETGRSCWGSGQQDARAAQGTMRMLGAATR